MKSSEFLTELATSLVQDNPNKKVWTVQRQGDVPSSKIFIYRQLDKVRIDADVGGEFNKPDDAPYAKDAISLIRTWMRTIIEELPKFVKDTDTSIRIEAHGRRATIYARFMPAILEGLREVNPGWEYNGGRYVDNLDATLFTFSNFNYNKSRDKWIDRRTQQVNEIKRIPPNEYAGGKNTLKMDDFIIQKRLENARFNLGNGLVAAADGYGVEVFDLEKKLLVGRLYLHSDIVPGINQRCFRVETITTHEDYRGMGLGDKMYMLMILPPPKGLGTCIISGHAQTPAGRKNWIRLNQVPGVQVTGLIEVYDKILDEQMIDAIMEQGCLYLGNFGNARHFFEFPVEQNADEMEASVKNAIAIYSDRSPDWGTTDIGLMARYVG